MRFIKVRFLKDRYNAGAFVHFLVLLSFISTHQMLIPWIQGQLVNQKRLIFSYRRWAWLYQIDVVFTSFESSLCSLISFHLLSINGCLPLKQNLRSLSPKKWRQILSITICTHDWFVCCFTVFQTELIRMIGTF